MTTSTHNITTGRGRAAKKTLDRCAIPVPCGPAIDALRDSVAAGGAVEARGIYGSSAHLVAASLARSLKRPMIVVVAHIEDADEVVEELAALAIDASLFPAMEIVAGQTAPALDLVAERLVLTSALRANNQPQVIVAPIQALMQLVPSADRIGDMLRVIRPGDTLDQAALARWLDGAGYTRVPAVEGPAEFAVRGGIIDLFPPGAEPARIDMFGDEVEAIFAIDLDTMGSDRRLSQLQIVGASVDQLLTDDASESFVNCLVDGTCAVLFELSELTEQGRSYFDRARAAGGISGPPAVFKALGERCHSVVQLNQFTPAGGSADGTAPIELPVSPLPPLSENVAQAIAELGELATTTPTQVVCQNPGEVDRLEELLREHGGAAGITVSQHYLHRGFIWGGGRQGNGAFALVPYHEMLHRFQMRRRVRRMSGGRALDSFVDLQPGDIVVHRDHGIARYIGMQSMKPRDKAPPEEYLSLEFARNAKLHVPASKIELVQKYIGAFRGEPELSTLGGRKWKNQKDKVRDAVHDLAADMLRLQAARASMPGITYPADTKWMREFEASFPYEETEDQALSIEAVKRDMMRDRPMDRLICGDVGFGKTEIAIRAAFKAAEFGKQVAVLVPTTVLAEQHERTFRERFADYPFRVESLSRFKTKKQQNELLKQAALGQIDIIVGTHRLLSKDVKFADLGLVIIDEEQRFGVEHKQRLLELRATVDVLTLTATPIPRTLHMSMLGLRDISSLSTAPADRRAIVTEVIGENEYRIRTAIDRELARDGQIFYVHNRVHDILDVAHDVQAMAPEAMIVVGHGQMPARELEKVMITFMSGRADILVSTTIIESGIDIPTANTMIIDDSHMFGLSELHQLRGRVGRHKHRAYCYLIVPQDRSIPEVAMKRLAALEQFTMLGSGFKIAMRDLEIRGAGNILGAEQSGHISAVGYEMYCQLLEHAVRELEHGQSVSTIDTTIDIGVTGALPKAYIPSDARRLDAYRRLSRASTLEALEQIERDIQSAYGELPRAAEMFVDLGRIRVAAALLHIDSITRHEQDIIFKTRQPSRLERVMEGAKGSLRVVRAIDKPVLRKKTATSTKQTAPAIPGSVEVFYRPPKSYLEASSLVTLLRRRLTAGQDGGGDQAPQQRDVSAAGGSAQRVRGFVHGAGRTPGGGAGGGGAAS